MATDFRDGKTFPRRGRQSIDGVLWLLRVSDKARAAAAGTIHDYIYPCPMDKGMMERWGITPREFEQALATYKTDDELVHWLKGRAAAGGIAAANDWLLKERTENLDRQDAEEGVAVG
jgi:Domain of unknown function (DUF5069)